MRKQLYAQGTFSRFTCFTIIKNNKVQFLFNLFSISE